MRVCAREGLFSSECLCDSTFFFFFGQIRVIVFICLAPNVRACLHPRVLQRVAHSAAALHSARGSAGERDTFSSKCIKRPLLKPWLPRQLFPSTGVVAQPLARPHVCLGGPPPPCRLAINPAVTMATVPVRASSRFLEVRRGYSAESRVKCCPNDLGRQQNKCEGEASCLCIRVEN